MNRNFTAMYAMVLMLSLPTLAEEPYFSHIDQSYPTKCILGRYSSAYKSISGCLFWWK